MEQTWTLEKVRQFIDNQIEESNSLEYKAAGALSNTDGKKNELAKDVSAFANSNGAQSSMGSGNTMTQGKDIFRRRLIPSEGTKSQKSGWNR